MASNNAWEHAQDGNYDIRIGTLSTEIRINNSDGMEVHWPGNDGKRPTERTVFDIDQVNYFEPCEVGDKAHQKRLKHWFKRIGNFLAQEVANKDGCK
jgi:hypothetical protein